MEFPPEIVAIIREYSLPRFKYFREYKRILRMRYLSEWMALYEVLMKRPEDVIPIMLEFEEAHSAYEPAKQLFYFTTWYSKETELDFYEKRARLIQAEQSMYRVIYPQ
jgi:hypothetical protein